MDCHTDCWTCDFFIISPGLCFFEEVCLGIFYLCFLSSGVVKIRFNPSRTLLFYLFNEQVFYCFIREDQFRYPHYVLHTSPSWATAKNRLLPSIIIDAHGSPAGPVM